MPQASYAAGIKWGLFQQVRQHVSCTDRHVLAAAGAACGSLGVIDLSFQDDRESGRRRRSDQPSDSGNSRDTGAKRRRKASESAEVGQALRTIYDRTVNEAIPAEMLDLLGKLD